SGPYIIPLSGSLKINCCGPRNDLNFKIMSGTELILKEGWKIVTKEEKGQVAYYVKTPYEDQLGLLKAKHPAWLHLEIYAKHTDPNVKYQHMKRAHDILWPQEIWHEWTERRFK